jgi:hypothetical protein
MINGSPKYRLPEHLEDKISRLAEACYTSNQSILNFIVDMQVKNLDETSFVRNIQQAMKQASVNK